MNKENVGYVSGFFATLTLSEFHLVCGIICALVMAFCAIPSGLTKWRNFIYDYRTFCEETGVSGVLVFFAYIVGMRRDKKDRAQLEISFPRNRDED